jgi:hypothetical protein
MKNIDNSTSIKETEPYSDIFLDEIIKTSKHLEEVLSCQNQIQVTERFESIDTLYTQFIKSDKNKELNGFVHLNKSLLYIAVKSYFSDIYRFKLYSNSKLANTEKKCAYLIKWISKIKPIQIYPHVELKDISTEIIYVNSEFALYIGMIFFYLKKGINIFKFISKEFYKELLYTCFYRDINPKMLSTIMHALYLNAKNAIKADNKKQEN